jgi:hypothetical protein
MKQVTQRELKHGSQAVNIFVELHKEKLRDQLSIGTRSTSPDTSRYKLEVWLGDTKYGFRYKLLNTN